MKPFSSRPDTPGKKSAPKEAESAITLACTCGKVYKVSSSKVAAGARFSCRECGRSLSTPNSVPVEFAGGGGPQDEASWSTVSKATLEEIRRASAAEKRGRLRRVSVAAMGFACLTAAVVYFLLPEKWAALTALVSRDLGGSNRRLTAGFDLKDIDKTNAWAAELAASFRALADKEAKRANRLAGVRAELEALRGQAFEWDLAVSSVSDSQVIVHGSLPALRLSHMTSDRDGTIVLKMGDEVLSDDVANLPRGVLRVRGTIDGVFVQDILDYRVMVSVSQLTTAAAYTRSRQPPITVSIVALKNAFADPATGQKLYAGKKIEVTGWHSFELFGDFLRDPNDKAVTVRCRYSERLPEKVLADARNQRATLLTVVGTCDEEGTLTNCRLVKAHEK